MVNQRFHGKVAIVTGAGSGVGRAVALALGAEGANVVAADINPETGQETVNLIQDTNGEGIFVQSDLTASDDVQRVVKQAVDKYGRIDIVANVLGNAIAKGTVLDFSETDWHRMLALNLDSTFLVSKYSIPHMAAAGGGAIVNVGAAPGSYGMPNNAALSAAKAGVHALTKAMAIDHAAQNIRVNCISPGAINSPQIRRTRSPEELVQIAKGNLQKRIGEPSEIADVILYLASESASYVTGKVLEVDGGR